MALSLKSLTKILGPGVITGAADDDPSGIATYSQAGAQTGFGLLWTVVLTWPMMVAVQSVSARIGRVTGKGLASNMLAVFPRSAVQVLVGLLFVANTINIGIAGSTQGIAGALTIEDPGVFDRINVVDTSQLGSPAITLDQFTPPGDTAFGRLSGLSPATISFETATQAVRDAIEKVQER